MKCLRIIFLFTLMCFASLSYAGECDDQYARGERPVVTNPVLSRGARPVCSPDGFEAMHWSASRTAIWSAEHLTRERVSDGKALDRKDSFHEEESVPAGDRAMLRDYARSGFDRGHLAPNKDMGDRRTQRDCFSLANMIPQDPNNNQNLWEGIESAVRSYVSAHGDIYVITGPIFPGRGQQADFLKGRVLVPVKVYKIVYDPRLKQARAYLANNAPGMEWESKSVQEISSLAQIDFFPWMDERQKRSDELVLPVPTPHGHNGRSNRPSHKNSFLGNIFR